MSDLNEQRVLEAFFRVDAMGHDVSEIKVAMKEMASALSRLAVIEERQTHDRAEMSRVFKRLDTHDGRLGNLELAQPLQKQSTALVQRIVEMVLTAVVTAVITGVVVHKVDTANAQKPPVLVAPAK